MKFNTALCFFLAGISLWFLKNEEGEPNVKYTGRIFAGLVVLISAATIGEYLFGWDLGIDQILIKDLATLPVNFPGRMSQITAICFTFIGIALLLVDISFSQYFSISVILLSLLAVIGYLFDYQALYQLGGYGTIALHTAITFLILSIAIFFARPYLGLMKIGIGDRAGSRAFRLLIPLTALLTILLGWLVEIGEHIHLLNPGNKVAILVVLLIVIYSPLIYFYAHRINRADEQIIRLNRLYATLSYVNQTIVKAKDQQGLYKSICKVAVEQGHFALAWIGLLDETSGDITPVAAHGMDINNWPFPIVNIHKGDFKGGIIATAIRTSSVATSDDISTDKKFTNLYDQFQQFAHHSSAAVPFQFQRETIGILSLISPETGLFKSEEEVRLLKEMGLDISFALDNIEAERAKAYMAAIVESSYDAVIAKDLNGIVTSWNFAAQNIFGYEAKEMIGQPILKLIPPEKMEEEEYILNQVKQNKPVNNFETERVRKDGKRIDVSITVSPVLDATGRVMGASKILRDITERKQAETKVQQQNQRLRVLREIDMAILRADSVENIVDVALSHSRELLGCRRAGMALIDQEANEVVIFNASMAGETSVTKGSRAPLMAFQAMPQAISKPLANNQPVLIHDLTELPDLPPLLQILNNEGLRSVCILPLFSHSALIGTVNLLSEFPGFFDEQKIDLGREVANQMAIAVTQNKLIEDLRDLNAELEGRVDERTAQLHQTNLELEHANRTKDEFLANMSHELRTPLNGILGMSEMLLEQRRDPLSPRQQNSLKVIESSGQHLLELITDILDLSKIEAGKFDVYPQPVNVEDLCRSSLVFVKSQAMKKFIDINYEEDKTISNIYVDPRRIKQILVNLLTNAIKFTPDHGQVTLQVHADVDQDVVQFSVIDTGIGIKPEDLQQLFKPFTQINSSLNRQQEGTGLGLALIQKLTDLHGGSVQVESQAGAGSSFTINLPWGRHIMEEMEGIKTSDAEAAKNQDMKRSKQSVEPQERRTVLLAEDNLSNVLTVGEYMEDHGYEVLVAHDGQEAVDMAEKNDPDIILMDIQMPVMDGLEAIRRLRANPRFATTPIIALTALAMPGDRERCLQAGATEYLSKPVSLKGLVKTISELLEK